MSKFTQGEWRYREVDPISEELNTHKYVLWAVGERTLQSIGYIFTEANARLIVAAPKMYKLLKVWVQVQAQPTLMDARDTARKLLASIEGEKAEE